MQPSATTQNRNLSQTGQTIRLLLFVMGYGYISSGESLAANKPIANAGPDLRVSVGHPVTLDGTASADPVSGIKSYRWQQTRGPKVKLTRQRTPTASFVSPARLKRSASAVPLVFKLTVANHKRAVAQDNVTVIVTREPLCQAPQILLDGACRIPAPVCALPRVMLNGQCIVPPVRCEAPQVEDRGSCVTPTPSCVAPATLKNGSCVAPPPDCGDSKVLRAGVCIDPPPTAAFNDTGVTGCSDTHSIGLDCPLSAYPDQDAERGRDVTHFNPKDGHAGFSFAKLGPDGAELPLSAEAWTCVRDKVTGLVWEVKTTDGGFRDQSRDYTHLGVPVAEPLGLDSLSDADQFVAAVNKSGLCGATDWRLPTAIELQSLVDYSIGLPGPTIDVRFFPNSSGARYWTSEPYLRSPGHGVVVYFDDGRVFDEDRGTPVKVRLVRSAR